MREMQIWGSKTPHRRCGKNGLCPGVMILIFLIVAGVLNWIIMIIAGTAILILK